MFFGWEIIVEYPGKMSYMYMLNNECQPWMCNRMPAIYGIYRNGGHLIKFYMQIMVHLPPTNLNLPSTYLAVARNSPPTPAQTEIGKYEFVHIGIIYYVPRQYTTSICPITQLSINNSQFPYRKRASNSRSVLAASMMCWWWMHLPPTV